MDIFFTQRYEYTLNEDADAATARLFSAIPVSGLRGTVLAENGFRLGHPFKMIPFLPGWTHLAYLSGSVDHLLPKRLPPLEPDGDPVYVSRAVIEIRIRPNLFFVILTYCATLLLGLDLLGIELFWRSNYLLRLAVVTGVEVGCIWVMLSACAGLKKRFDKVLANVLSV